MQVPDKNLLITDVKQTSSDISVSIKFNFNIPEDLMLVKSKFAGYVEIDETETLKNIYRTISESLNNRAEHSYGNVSEMDFMIFKGLLNEAITSLADFASVQSIKISEDV